MTKRYEETTEITATDLVNPTLEDGLETKQVERLPFSREEQHLSSAWHESAHAVFCWRYEYWMSSRLGDGVSIGGGGGIVHFQGEALRMASLNYPPGMEDPFRLESLEIRVQREAEISFAGYQAERKYWRSVGRDIPPQDIAEELEDMEGEGVNWRWDFEPWQRFWEDWGEPAGDLPQAAYLLSLVTPREGLLGALRASRDRVTRLLRHPRTWAAVEAVAQALIDHRHLSSERVETIIAEVNPPRWAWFPPDLRRRLKRAQQELEDEFRVVSSVEGGNEAMSNQTRNN